METEPTIGDVLKAVKDHQASTDRRFGEVLKATDDRFDEVLEVVNKGFSGVQVQIEDLKSDVGSLT